LAFYRPVSQSKRRSRDEAHKNGLRVAAHIYDLDDAKAIVRAGVDIIAHGVRHKPVDAEFRLCINLLRDEYKVTQPVPDRLADLIRQIGEPTEYSHNRRVKSGDR
jgi:hypothetical protein